MEIEKLIGEPTTLQIVQDGKVTHTWTMEKKIIFSNVVPNIIDNAHVHYEYLYKMLDQNCHYDKKRKKWIKIKNCRKHPR